MYVQSVLKAMVDSYVLKWVVLLTASLHWRQGWDLNPRVLPLLSSAMSSSTVTSSSPLGVEEVMVEKDVVVVMEGRKKQTLWLMGITVKNLPDWFSIVSSLHLLWSS